MLGDFALETFVGLVGEVFRVTLDDGSMLELRLASAVASSSRPNAEPPGRAPFSTVFHGPPEPILPQRIYPFQNDTLGEFEMFIVPIGPEGPAMQYEAVFA